jgi:hypothetical protein
MALKYRFLDSRLRDFMLAELMQDLQKNSLYLSPRLIAHAEPQWIELFKEAIKTHDETWFAKEVRRLGLIKTHEEKAQRDGKVFLVPIPASVAESLTETEFNRMYVRAVCFEALADQEEFVQICKGRETSSPRLASEVKVGRKIPAAKLLSDLRANLDVDTALGIPLGPNSGLTVKRIGARITNRVG